MNFFNEYALLIVVALPVVVIAGMEIALFVSGERGTGLIPGFNRYPSIETGKTAAIEPQVASEAPAITAVEPSNDEVERLAA
jgi:hypothetical protein